MTQPLPIARSAAGKEVVLLPAFANRHGLIAGATGTGKTVTLQVVAEGLSRIGVPVFMADVKGDLAGIAAAGALTPRLQERLGRIGAPPPEFAPCPAVLWDLEGRAGHPVRATISDMGPLLLGRLLDLNPIQQGVLALVFKLADDSGLLLLDLKDLRAMLQFVGDNARQITTEYGNVSAVSIGAIQRALLSIEQQGGERFFGEPMLDIDDFIRTDDRGRGTLNILAAASLMRAPKLYATFLLWMLSELFEQLPEVGDPEKPKLVFFFDEAHLLFADAPPPLVERIEQVVRLIRSKGVGVWFVTQNPLDVPDVVLGQLAHRVQHALRAFTPRDQKAVKAAASTLRANPALDTESVISELGTGEALVSFLDATGSPTIVERAFILPPGSRIGPLTDVERAAIVASSPVAARYDRTEDRASAYETLVERTLRRAGGAQGGEGRQAPGASGTLSDFLFGSTGPRGGHREGMIESAAKSMSRSIGSRMGREILRGVMGTIFGSRR